MAIKYKSEIKINVGLDENRIPEKIYWSADDGNIKDMEAQAVLLSVWDTSNKDTFSVNLWTKEMPINEMKQFFHQTLVAMKNSYHTATSDEKMAATMQDFCDYFYENMMKE
jgi:gliding motility-associated protein GldC